MDSLLSNYRTQPSSHPSVILSGAGTFSYSFEPSKGQIPKWVTADRQKYPVPDQRGLNSVRRARNPRNQAQKPFDVLAGLLSKNSPGDWTPIELSGEAAAAWGSYLHALLAAVSVEIQTYFNNDIVAYAVVIGGTFLGTLLVVSVITVRFSDMVLDSRVGALDRTMGFLFGLARGLIIVVVAFLFFAWLVPDRSQPEWVRSAKSRVVLQGTGDWLMSMLPEDLDATISKRLKKPKPEEDESGQRSELPAIPAAPVRFGAVGQFSTTQ